MEDRRRTYRNPLIPDYLGDPFVWSHEGRYYLLGTGADEAAGTTPAHHEPSIFPAYSSTDLVSWSRAGKALVRPYATHGYTFWAPEVAYSQGIFYLYYSVGFGDRLHHLRVATSRQPLGPYRDAGVRLTSLASCPFAIDPHPFFDGDRWYLFYARDFLDDRDEQGNPVRPGTALVVQPLDSMLALAPTTITVLRARHDWQRFMSDRPMYGARYDWHTLEGPAVVRRNGRIYCLYSGGRWDSERYGIDYAVADHVLGPYDGSGSEEGPRVLRSKPGAWLGPGHNSIVRGPDGTTDYVAYHAWDPAFSRRQFCLDPLVFESSGPRVDGPSTTLRSVEPARTARAS
ncbi:MAG TPA: glycoside hydrolase family 43 protein [Polyangiaceae bacterium]